MAEVGGDAGPEPSPVGSQSGEHSELFSGRGRLFKFVEGDWADAGKVEAKLLHSSASGKFKMWLQKYKSDPPQLVVYHSIGAEDSVVSGARARARARGLPTAAHAAPPTATGRALRVLQVPRVQP